MTCSGPPTADSLLYVFTLLDDDPPSATEDAARFRLRVRHLSLSELEAQGVVKWDRDEHIVEKGRRFYETWDKIR